MLDEDTGAFGDKLGPCVQTMVIAVTEGVRSVTKKEEMLETKIKDAF